MEVYYSDSLRLPPLVTKFLFGDLPLTPPWLKEQTFVGEGGGG